MEADKFDKLMAEKLVKVDVPQFNESQWIALNAKLPSTGISSNLIIAGLLALLLLSNVWWFFKMTEPEENNLSTTVSLGHKRDSLIIQKQIVVVHDTVYQSIEVERIVYINVTKEGGHRTVLATLDGEEGVYAVNQYSKKSEVIALDSNIESIIGKGGIIEFRSLNSESAMPIDSLSWGEIKQELLVGEDKEDPDIVVKKKREKTSYEGPRWLMGFNGQKPWSIGSKSENFKGSGFGLDIEFIPTSWISMIAEVNLLNRSYTITDEEFYGNAIALSDSELYPTTGVYGDSYSWKNSQVSTKSTQMGLIFKLSSPSKNFLIKPFISSGFLLDLREQADVINRLSENGTEKIILVESTILDDQNNSYIRSELGLETQLNGHFWFRVSADYWKQLEGNQYESDLIGAKAVIVYTLK